MKILFIFRESLSSEYILTKILPKYPGAEVIIETGKTAKYQKLKRTFKRSNVFNWPVDLINLFALFVYSRASTSYLKSRIRVKNIKPLLRVSDVNDIECIAAVTSLHPTMIFVFGVGIIRLPFLKEANAPVFNIHTGIVPQYRNVHSDFWAYKNKDYQNIGVTLMHLDEGIDSGAIALQERVTVASKESLFAVQLKLLKLIPNQIEKAIILFKQKKLPKVKQSKTSVGFYKTPTALNFLSLILAK